MMIGRLFCIASMLFAATVASGDTLSVVGVAVRKQDGQRVAGALVKLVAASASIGVLAQDRTSDRGVFNLYCTNLAGDIGDLYVVYDGPDAATPLRVTVGVGGRNGYIDIRTGDLVVLTSSETAMLSEDDAAEQLSAVIKTQAVLAHAGLITKEKADQVVAARSAALRPHIVPSELALVRSKTFDKLSEFKLSTTYATANDILKDHASDSQ